MLVRLPASAYVFASWDTKMIRAVTFLLLACIATPATAQQAYDIRGVRVGAQFSPPQGATCQEEVHPEKDRTFTCPFEDDSRLFARASASNIVADVRYEFRTAEELTPNSRVGKALVDKYGSFKKSRKSWVWNVSGGIKLTAECWNNFCALQATDPRVWAAEKLKRRDESQRATLPKF